MSRGRVTLAYGDHPDQRADLHLPDGDGPVPVAVVIHGGFWRAAYGYDLGTPLAADLAGRGWAAWNVEYRRVGAGGGWPTTPADVAAAVDALSGPAERAAGGRLDLDRVVTIGHSAGGHLAVWAAARHRLPAGTPGADPAVRVRGAVSQAGVLDLVDGARRRLGTGAVRAFVGASPDAAPDRYATASPAALVPLGIPVALVHGEDDGVVPIAQSERFAAAARVAGDHVTLDRLVGVGHFELIDPASSAWATCRRRADELIRG